MAAKFENNGASRVAWKLCDPSENTRYTMDMLFDDPWFQSVEMCIYESPDQEVNPFVLPGTGENIDTHSVSGYSSVNNSQAPSRRGTFTSRPVGSGAGSGYNSHDESSNGLSSSFRSMLDLKDIPQKITKLMSHYQVIHLCIPMTVHQQEQNQNSTTHLRQDLIIT